MAARVHNPSTAAATALTEVVNRLRRALRTSIRTDYPWESLPMAQVEVLFALRDDRSTRVGELATRQRLAPSTVSGLVQALVDSGLVARGPDPTDRRVAVVSLTDAGRDLLGAWEQAHLERFAGALNKLSSSERADIGAALPALSHLADLLGGGGS